MLPRGSAVVEWGKSSNSRYALKHTLCIILLSNFDFFWKLLQHFTNREMSAKHMADKALLNPASVFSSMPPIAKCWTHVHTFSAPLQADDDWWLKVHCYLNNLESNHIILRKSFHPWPDFSRVKIRNMNYSALLIDNLGLCSCKWQPKQTSIGWCCFNVYCKSVSQTGVTINACLHMWSGTLTPWSLTSSYLFKSV